MSDHHASRGRVDVQLGARARSILSSLASARPRLRSEAAAPVEQAESAPTYPTLVSSRPSKAERVAARRAAAENRSKGAPAEVEPAPAPSNTVVPLPQRVLPRRKVLPPPPADFVVPSAARRAGARKKRSVVRISAVLAIALPTGLATLYYGVIAAPQYVAEARFAVRGPADIPSRGGDGIGALAGMGASPLAMISDSFIVAQFIQSGQLVGDMQRSLDLRSIYTNDKADFVAKYRPYGSEDTVEHLTSYWNTVSWVYFEPVTGIITFTVRAFSPAEALKVARETVRESERLVNRLSDRAREDSVRLAKQEQSRAELRLKFARKAIQDYRDRRGAPDAQSVVASQFKIVSDLEGDLAKREAELGASAGFLSKDSPSVRVKQSNIDSLRSRIATERAKIGSQTPGANGGQPLSASMAEFENLETERGFAEKGYESASQAVEAARVNAERQSRYLTTFVEPHLPEDSLYPARLKMILLVFICSAIAWAVGALIFYGIRDHSA